MAQPVTKDMLINTIGQTIPSLDTFVPRRCPHSGVLFHVPVLSLRRHTFGRLFEYVSSPHSV